MTAIDKVRNSVADIQVGGVPYFDFGKWHEATQHLTDKNLTAITQGQKFPLVFLLLDIKETKNNNTNLSNANIDLYIINKTEQNYTPTERDAITFTVIREIEQNLIKSFKNNAVQFDEYGYEELFYDITKKNKLESVIDVIHLNISNFNYKFTNC